MIDEHSYHLLKKKKNHNNKQTDHFSVCMQIILISVKIKVWKIVFLLLYLDYRPPPNLYFAFFVTLPPVNVL